MDSCIRLLQILCANLREYIQGSSIQYNLWLVFPRVDPNQSSYRSTHDQIHLKDRKKAQQQNCAGEVKTKLGGWTILEPPNTRELTYTQVRRHYTLREKSNSQSINQHAPCPEVTTAVTLTYHVQIFNQKLHPPPPPWRRPIVRGYRQLGQPHSYLVVRKNLLPILNLSIPLAE